VFGDGLAEVGAEASYLVPVPWYLLVTASVLDGENEVAFRSPDGRDLEGFAALKNVFDVTDDATLELGASYTLGRNADRLLSQVAGGHLVLKWKPAAQATTRSAVVTIEGLYARLPLAGLTWGRDGRLRALRLRPRQMERKWYLGGADSVPRGRRSAVVRVGPAIWCSFNGLSAVGCKAVSPSGSGRLRSRCLQVTTLGLRAQVPATRARPT
jgi:hypothetical protein